MQSQFWLDNKVGFGPSHNNQEENLFTFTVFPVFLYFLVWLDCIVNSAVNGLYTSNLRHFEELDKFASTKHTMLNLFQFPR